jgi:hypothetical protein
MKYRVVTEVSSLDDPELDLHGRHILFTSNNFQKARKEAIEWAAYDDIEVLVINQYGSVKFTCDGYSEAETRYPKTVDALDNSCYN